MVVAGGKRVKGREFWGWSGSGDGEQNEGLNMFVVNYACSAWMRSERRIEERSKSVNGNGCRRKKRVKERERERERERKSIRARRR